VSIQPASTAADTDPLACRVRGPATGDPRRHDGQLPSTFSSLPCLTGRVALAFALTVALALPTVGYSIAGAKPGHRHAARHRAKKGALTGKVLRPQRGPSCEPLHPGGPPPTCPPPRLVPGAGVVTLYGPSGKVVARTSVRAGHHFRYVLRAGSYRLTVAPSTTGSVCGQESAMVKSRQTTRQDVVCNVP